MAATHASMATHPHDWLATCLEIDIRDGLLQVGVTGGEMQHGQDMMIPERAHLELFCRDREVIIGHMTP